MMQTNPLLDEKGDIPAPVRGKAGDVTTVAGATKSQQQVTDIHEDSSDMGVSSADKATNMVQFLYRKDGCWFITILVTLIMIDVLLGISTVVYLVNGVRVVKITKSHEITWQNINDMIEIVYRIIIISLCLRFMYELILGRLTDEQLKQMHDLTEPERQVLSKQGSMADASCCDKIGYFFRNLQLNQFTLSYVLCTVHQLYCAVLLWIAVYDKRTNDKWYILTGINYFFGAFSIPLPGICFIQYIIVKSYKCDEKEEDATQISMKSKAERIGHTYFDESIFVFVVFAGFLIEFFQFIFMSSMHLKDISNMDEFVYHCDDTPCHDRPDFNFNEIIYRLFVGMSIFNNITLLLGVLWNELHFHTSLTYLTKLFNPLYLILLLMSLLFDLRITDHYWTTEFLFITISWIFAHFVGIVITFKLLCCHFWPIQHQMDRGSLKKNHIHGVKSLMIEGFILLVFAFIAVLFISIEDDFNLDFKNRQNWLLWRQWITMFYFLFQIFTSYLQTRTQQVNLFESPFYDNHEKLLKKGFRPCLIYTAFLNCYDLIFSFIFEIREFDHRFVDKSNKSDNMSDIGDMGDISNIYKNVTIVTTSSDTHDTSDTSDTSDENDYYKWSFSLSFAISHLILWALCCSIEFIVKFDQMHEQHKQKLKNQHKQSYASVRGGSGGLSTEDLEQHNRKLTRGNINSHVLAAYDSTIRHRENNINRDMDDVTNDPNETMEHDQLEIENENHNNNNNNSNDKPIVHA